jgi:hypothetical protein
MAVARATAGKDASTLASVDLTAAPSDEASYVLLADRI